MQAIVEIIEQWMYVCKMYVKNCNNLISFFAQNTQFFSFHINFLFSVLKYHLKRDLTLNLLCQHKSGLIWNIAQRLFSTFWYLEKQEEKVRGECQEKKSNGTTFPKSEKNK